MSITLRCAHCERGRVMWAGEDYECVQCGWVAPEDTRHRLQFATRRATGEAVASRTLAFERIPSTRGIDHTVRRHRGTPAAA